MTTRGAILAAIGLSVAALSSLAGPSGAHAQEADAPRVADPPRSGDPRQGQGISGSESARGTARTQGVTAAPAAAVPAGTLKLDNGLSFLLNYTGEFAANPSGGLRQGADFAGQLFVGVDADFNKIAGIQGASGHFIFTDRQGRNMQTDYIGNDTSVQEIFGGGQTYRLTALSFEQKLFNDRLDLEAGRLPAQGSFLVSPIYCNFQNNATCGSPVTVFKDTNFTFFPDSTYGGHAKLWLDPAYKLFIHAGIYEVNPNRLLEGDHGFNFTTNGATGVVIPMELGYSTTAATDRYPRNYGIGAVVDQSKYSDPVLDAAGGNAVTTGGASLTQFGRSVVYARFDQMIYRPDPDSPRGITLFGLGMVGTGGRQIQNFFAEGGAIWTGAFAGRPFDTIGFVVSDQNYSDLGLFNLRTATAAAGLNPGMFADNQIMMELNYGIQVNPAVRLLPQLQYIVNPTNLGAPYLTRPIPNALVLGAKISIDLFTLAGLAKGPGSL